MKRKSKFTFFELKVTFYFDLFKFFIGGIYDEKDKSVHLSLIPFFVIKLENARNLIKGEIMKQAIDKTTLSINKVGEELPKLNKKKKAKK
jgi:hypothetical protein